MRPTQPTLNSSGFASSLLWETSGWIIPISRCPSRSASSTIARYRGSKILSGIWPRGSNSAPGNGNTGMVLGSSPGPRYSALIGICSPGQFAGSVEYALRKQDGRQPLSSFDGRFVGAAPRLEELHQLLARAVIVPLAIALDDFQQLVGRFTALALRIERGREVESRLMIERVRGDLLLQFGHRTDRLGLFGKVDRSLYRLDGGIIALRFRHHRQRLFGLLDRASRHIAFRQPRQRRDV